MTVRLKAGTNKVKIQAKFYKGNDVLILKEGHDMHIDPDKLPETIGDKLMCEGMRISTVSELMSCIYLAGYEDASRDMVFAIVDLMSGEMKSRMFIDAYRHIPGFEFLDDIDFQDFIDEGEVRGYILNRLDDILYDEYNIDVNDGILDKLINFAATYPRIHEIKEITVSVTIDRYGSGITLYRDRINSLPGLGGFHAVKEDDPRYDDEFDKWFALLKEYVFIESRTEIFGVFDFGELVEKALATGNAFEMLPKSVRVTDEYKIDLSEME